MTGPNRSSKRPRRGLSGLARNTRGATAIEYGLIVALIVIAMVASFNELARITTSMWDEVNNKVTKAR